jgi:hypothetical protein
VKRNSVSQRWRARRLPNSILREAKRYSIRARGQEESKDTRRGAPGPLEREVRRGRRPAGTAGWRQSTRTDPIVGPSVPTRKLRRQTRVALVGATGVAQRREQLLHSRQGGGSPEARANRRRPKAADGAVSRRSPRFLSELPPNSESSPRRDSVPSGLDSRCGRG